MKVMGARALVKRLDTPVKSTIIELVEYNAPPSQYALVLATGEGARDLDGTRRPLDFKAGDTVITKPHSGAPVEIEGEDLFMIVEDDVLAILTN